MVRGGFCQRSQFRSVQPAVSVGSGHVNLFWGYDQQGQTAGVRQRVDFLASTDAQGGSTKQKKWDVGPQAGGDVQKPRCFELLTRELQVAEERRRRVAGTTAQSTSSRDFLLESDFDARANAAFAAQGVHGAVDEVLLHLFFSERFVALDLQGNTGTARGTELQGVMQPDGLKNGAQLMVASARFPNTSRRKLTLAYAGIRIVGIQGLRVWRRQEEFSARHGACSG